MQVLHKLEDGRLVHEVGEEKSKMRTWKCPECGWRGKAIEEEMYKRMMTCPECGAAVQKIEDTPVEKAQLAGVEFIEKATTLLVEDAIEFIEVSKEDAEVLSKVENKNFKVITDGSRFILKWKPYLPVP